MSTHTPGPWSSNRNPIYSQWWVSHDGGKPIATVKEEADGRLIAAAPDLLAALKAMVLNDTHTYRDCHKAARAAIAKAEGVS